MNEKKKTLILRDAQLESTVLQLEKEGIISSVQAPYQDSKIKIYYIARKVLDAPAKDVSESSSPSAPAPKGLSTALQERLQRKRAFMSPVKVWNTFLSFNSQNLIFSSRTMIQREQNRTRLIVLSWFFSL